MRKFRKYFIVESIIAFLLLTFFLWVKVTFSIDQTLYEVLLFGTVAGWFIVAFSTDVILEKKESKSAVKVKLAIAYCLLLTAMTFI